MTHYVLILAGGQGTRLNNAKYPKQFLNIGNKPMLMHSIQTFSEACPDSKIYIGLQKKDRLMWSELCEKYNFKIHHNLYVAGKERFETVFSGLNAIVDDFGLNKAIVSIHDAARPFIDSTLIKELLVPFKDCNVKATIPVIGLKNSILEYSSSHKKSLNRNNYLGCQTPQCFSFTDLLEAYQYKINQFERKKNSRTHTKKTTSLQENLHDDFTVFSQFFPEQKSIKLVEGRKYNIKITTDLDYFISEKVKDFISKTK